MLFVKPLTKNELETLDQLHRNHKHHSHRVRAHIILLSHRGYSTTEIKMTHQLCRHTIAKYIHAWENFGICGLLDKPRSGRPRRLTAEKDEKLIELINENPRSLKTVMAEFTREFGIEITLSTLKRLCKQAGLSWKRIRKSLKSKRDPEKYEASKKELESLIEQSREGSIDLFYFDESGFTLEPCVPYAWQEKGETIEVPSAKSKRLNVLGFIDRDSNFESFVFEGSVNTSVVVACIDQFAKNIGGKTTVLIVDNAPTHTSHEFFSNLRRWNELGLIIVPIAPYSPELNIIEIVWRKIKYEWIPFSAYESFGNLKQELYKILAGIGSNYIIQFE
jgi:transposase